MTSITTSGQCSECGEINDTVVCEGCKESFCLQHIAEHREELTIDIELHTLEHNHLLQQLRTKDENNEYSRKNILYQIDQWEKYMIERIHSKAEQAREQTHGINW